jgi:hypothetical protein
MNLDKEPYTGSYTKTLYEGDNQVVRASKCENVVTLTIFNVPPSVLKSLTIPAEFQINIIIDTAVGNIWQWNTDISRPANIRIAGTAIVNVTYYNESQGKMMEADDSIGAVFGSVTYIV